jgi:hypothetical protein
LSRRIRQSLPSTSREEKSSVLGDLDDICDAFPHPEHVELTKPNLQAQSGPGMAIVQAYMGVTGRIQGDPRNLNRSFIPSKVHRVIWCFKRARAFLNDRKAAEVPHILILNATTFLLLLKVCQLLVHIGQPGIMTPHPQRIGRISSVIHSFTHYFFVIPWLVFLQGKKHTHYAA